MMGEHHLSRDELARYHDGLLSASEEQAVGVHLEHCPSCAAILGSIRAFDEALHSEEVWHFADELETRRAQQRLQELEQQIAREDEEAARLLRPLLANPFRFLWSNIAPKKRYRTAGVVRVLARASADAREDDPLHALNLADAAIAIAESLPVDTYPARGVYHLHGLAWKERANACRYLNRYAGALDALDHAERAYRRLLQNDLELAVVDYVRGTVLWKQQRLDEALVYARACAAKFVGLRDHGRWVNAKLLEGSILVDHHASDAARDVFLVLREDGAAMEDDVTRARVENNLASAYLDAGDLGSASKHYLVALQLYESLEITTEAARTRWSIGLVALVAGNTAEAIRRLAAAKQECERLGMLGDAALVGLDLCEAYAVEQDHVQVRRLASEVMERVSSAGMVPAALTALSYLRESAGTRTLTPGDVRHVKRFVRRLEAEPHLIFTPPPASLPD